VADNQKITLSANGATDSLGVNFEQGAQITAEYPDLTGDARSDMRYNFMRIPIPANGSPILERH
jgi:hypothetical protein